LSDDGRTEAKYRRLPGKWLCAQRVYLGEDHLLVVESRYMVQEVRRFYFRDIHAILIAGKSGWRAANIVLSLATLFMVLLALGIGGGWGIFCWVMAGPFGLALVANVAAGPGCSCRLRTVVSDRRLAAMGRLRHAENLVALLAPLIEAAQREGPATERALAAGGGGSAETAAPSPAVAPAAPGTLQPGLAMPLAPRHYRGVAHMATFGMLLVAAGLAAGTALGGLAEEIGRYGTLPAYGVLMVLVVLALVKQRGTDMPGGVRKTAWWTLAYLGVVYLGWAALPALATSFGGVPKLSQFLLPPLEIGVVWAALVFCPLALGLIGLGLMVARRKSAR
jgi:hypothetical protein